MVRQAEGGRAGVTQACRERDTGREGEWERGRKREEEREIKKGSNSNEINLPLFFFPSVPYDVFSSHTHCLPASVLLFSHSVSAAHTANVHI